AREWVANVPYKVSVGSTEVIRMGQRLGVIPTIALSAVFLSTYPLYTPVTEVMESVLLGPFHVFCQFFQVIYFSAFYALTAQVSDIETLSQRYQALSDVRFPKRIAAAFKSLVND